MYIFISGPQRTVQNNKKGSSWPLSVSSAFYSNNSLHRIKHAFEVHALLGISKLSK